MPATPDRPTTTRLSEWPTWCLIAVIHGGWLLAAAGAERLGPLAAHGLLIVLTTWYMSLQHELLHGHPTRSTRLNRFFGLAPWAVWVPYDLYRESHLEHHRDERLTDPLQDPESNYLHAVDYRRLPAWARAARWSQRTVLGRLVAGPLFVIVPLWAGLLRPLRGDLRHARSWAQHLVLLMAMLWALDRWAGIGPLRYLLGIAWPALSLAMLRSLHEHRPAALPAHRSVVNEAGLFWRLLYLNNNYHAVHHADPALPWYRLRRAWHADCPGHLARNGGFLVPGYGRLLWRHLLRPIDSPVLGEPLPPPDSVPSTLTSRSPT